LILWVNQEGKWLSVRGCNPSPFYLHNLQLETTDFIFLFYTQIEICRLHSQNCKTRLLASSCVRLLTFRMEQLSCHWTDFYEIWYSNIFENLLRKFKF